MAKTAKKPLKATAKNIQWQIRAREQIQQLMLRLWVLLKENQQFANRQDFYQIVRMAQTAYSLWRAAFLTNVRNNENEILDRSRDFLERILTTNAIGFQDELGRNDFAVVYYNNNAKYRLERECIHDKTGELENEPEFIELLKISKDDDTERRLQDTIWNICYNALNKCLSRFEERVNQQREPD
jgi:hypothetical protein